LRRARYGLHRRPFSEVRKPLRHPLYELRKISGAGQYMMLVPLIDLKSCSSLPQMVQDFKSAALVE